MSAQESSKLQLRRFSNRIVGCPGCGEPRDDLRDDPDGDFVLFEDYERLRAMLERAAGTLNSLRADVEHTLWPNSGFAAPESRDG